MQAKVVTLLRRAADLTATSAGLPAPSQGPTVHAALDAYAAYARSNLLTAAEEGETQQTSAWGEVFAKQLERLKRGIEDRPLSTLDYAAIDDMASYWERRPPQKRTGRPVAIKTVKTQLKALRRFVKWAARRYGWTPPQFWEDATAKRPKMTDAEKAARKNPHQVKTFTPEQFATLHTYATPWERLLVMLSVCCGCGAAEISTLQIDDLHLDPDGQSYIRRIRGKEVTYGEHWICPELRTALEWALDRRKAMTRAEDGRDITWKPTSRLVLRETGKPVVGLTKASNSTNEADKEFKKLLTRIRKDQPDFPEFSFGKLRKTAANWIRQDRKHGGNEMSTLFLIHGNSSQDDENLDAYTDRDFRRLFRAQRRVYRRKLRATFARPVEWPLVRKQGGNNISQGTIERIRELDRQGTHPDEIIKTVGVSRATVYRHIAARKPRKPRSDRGKTRTPAPTVNAPQ